MHSLLRLFSDIVNNQIFTFCNVLKNLSMMFVVHNWIKEICRAYFVAKKKVSGFFNTSASFSIFYKFPLNYFLFFIKNKVWPMRWPKSVLYSFS
jgi:hypothetical protein